MEKKVLLKRGREEPLLRKHPWLFSGSIQGVEGDPGPGETVEVYDQSGNWIGRGAYSPQSQIRVRLWTWDRDEQVDEAFITERVSASIKRRSAENADPEVEAYREVHAESDLLPGVIVDRYAGFRVLQLLSVGAERWRDVIVDALSQTGECEGVYERSDVDARSLEGLSPHTGLLWGLEPPDKLEIREHGLRFIVDLRSGHKTGFYLDQRQNRLSSRDWIQGGSVLDAFCYTGAFTINACRAGSFEVLAIDSSQDALENAARNLALNAFGNRTVEWRVADVFSALRVLRDQARSFDVVILDPPRFAPTSAHVQRAARGYKDINLLGFKLLNPGGRLITFSCSGGVSPELFQKIVAGAALDAGVDAQIREWLGQPADHPVATAFPEGRYLKGMVCSV